MVALERDRNSPPGSEASLHHRNNRLTSICDAWESSPKASRSELGGETIFIASVSHGGNKTSSPVDSAHHRDFKHEQSCSPHSHRHTHRSRKRDCAGWIRHAAVPRYDAETNFSLGLRIPVTLRARFTAARVTYVHMSAPSLAKQCLHTFCVRIWRRRLHWHSFRST